MPDLVTPDQLSRETLVQIVSEIQRLLYLDLRSDREVWNPDKSWSAGDVPEAIAGILDEHGLAPREELPDTPLPPASADLIRLAEESNIQPEDLDSLVHDCASSLASRINNGGLDEQIRYLLDELGADELRQQLTGIAETKSV